MHIAARDVPAAAEGLRAVAVAAGDRPVRLSNIPDSDPVASAVWALGVAPDHVQFEMALAVEDGVLSRRARPARPGWDERGRLS